MNKLHSLFFGITLAAFSTICGTPEKDEEIHINILNTINQVTEVPPQKECLPCEKLFGAQLKECMLYQSNDDFKKQFFGLHYHARTIYILTLNRSEHATILSRFSSEEEWESYRNKLPDQEKICLPKTLKEQQHVIDNAENISYFWAYHDWFSQTMTHKKSRDECINEAKEEKYLKEKFELLKKYKEVVA